MTKLMIQTGTTYRDATAAEIADVHSQNILLQVNTIRPMLDSVAASRTFLVEMLGGRNYEVFVVVFLDNHHRVLEAVEMFRGTIDASAVHPREVVKAALWQGAAAVIFAHNHPSGVAEPSKADELVTARLRDALSLIDVRVLDHLVIALNRVTSFAERGLL
jgi:DNA repair protein RadC